MHTILRLPKSCRSTSLASLASLAVMLVAVPSLDAARKSKTDEAPAPQPEVFVPTDPYVSFLDELGKKSPDCKSHTDEVKKRLSALDDVVGRYQSAAPAERKKLIEELKDSSSQLAEVENKLTTCFDMAPSTRDGTGTWSAAEIPATALPAPEEETTPPPAASDEKQPATSAAKQALIEPEPSVPLPAIPPAPPREIAYLELLKQAAGNTGYGLAFSEDVEQLLAERRQLALRYLEAEDDDRPNLGFVIAVVSRRLRSSAEGVMDSATVATN